MRHTREGGVEAADSPEATVGPIGYMVIGEQSGTTDVIAGVPATSRYVDDTATSFAVEIPDAVDRAFGGDGEGGNYILEFDSTRDALHIVRMTAAVLSSAQNGTYVVEQAGDQYATGADFTGAARFIRVEFSDGTSAFINTSQTNPLEVTDGVVTDGDDDVGRAHRFGVTTHADGTVSLHAYDGHYISVEADGSLTGGATDVSTSEKFHLINLSQLAMSPTPDLRLQEQDMDGDDDPEMVLVVEQEDGTGYFILEPLGIADVLYKAGYEPDDAFVSSLSATQQAALLESLDGVVGIDSIADIDGATLQSVLDSMDEGSLTRSYNSYAFEYVLEGSLYQASASSDDGLFGATVTLGEYSVMVDNDDFGTGYAFSGSLLTVEGHVGDLSVSASVLSANAESRVDENGFAFAQGLDLVSVTVMVGDEDGSYASVSAGVGTGWAIAGAWGQNDQYGATIDFPIVPVAVAVYVKGEDAENVVLAIGGWSIETYDDVLSFAEHTWNASGDMARDAVGDVTAAVADDYNAARANLSTFAGRAVVLAADPSGTVSSVVDDIGADLGPILDDIGGAFGSAGDTFVGILEATGDFFSFDWLL